MLLFLHFSSCLEGYTQILSGDEFCIREGFQEPVVALCGSPHQH